MMTGQSGICFFTILKANLFFMIYVSVWPQAKNLKSKALVLPKKCWRARLLILFI
jgi:hypothetical protein